MVIQVSIRVKDIESEEYKQYESDLEAYRKLAKERDSQGITLNEEPPEEPDCFKHRETYFLEGFLKENLSHFMLGVEGEGTITLCFIDHSYIVIEKTDDVFHKLKEL